MIDASRVRAAQASIEGLPRPVALVTLSFFACLVGCSGDVGPTGPGPGPSGPSATPPSVNYSVRGVVADSLTGRGVEGATVQVGEWTTTSDLAGFYQLDGVSPGRHTLAVTSTAHRPFSTILAVRSDTIRNVLLWRLAPYLEFLTADEWGTTASWVDLDGDFPSSAWARFHGPLSVREYLSGFSEPITPIVRHYFFPRAVRVGRIDVELIDLSGHRGFFECLPAWICREE